MTRDELSAAVAGILTAEQREQIQHLHDQVEEGWLDGCAAHAESAECCVDVLVKAAAQS